MTASLIAATPRPPVDLPPIALIDARGMRCPWPVLRLARGLRDGAAVVDLLSDDPAAAAEIASFVAERGLTVVPIAGGFRIGAR